MGGQDKRVEDESLSFQSLPSRPEAANRHFILFYLLPPSVDMKSFTYEKYNLVLPPEIGTAQKI